MPKIAEISKKEYLQKEIEALKSSNKN